MNFAKRAAVRMTPTAKIKTWRSIDAPFAIEEVRSLYGLAPRVLLVERLANGNASIVSRHRKRDAALRAAAKHRRAS